MQNSFHIETNFAKAVQKKTSSRSVPESFLNMKRPVFQSFLVHGVHFAAVLAFMLTVSGCASMKHSSVKPIGQGHVDLSETERQLKEEPDPQVDMTEVEEAAQYFEEEDRSLSAMTAEKFSKHLKLACLKMVRLEPNEEIALALFEQGVQLFEKGEYLEAAEKLGWAGFRWPETPLEEDALFLRAESLFFANRYAKAQRAYEKLLKRFDSTRYMDRVSPRLFAIAQYWEKLDQIYDYHPLAPNFSDKTRPMFGTFGNSIKAYRTITMHDPNGLWAEHAMMAAGNANYIRGEYFDAANFYDDLIKNYPQSKHLLPACELNLSSKLLMYQGPEYDGTALEDAEVLTDRLLTQFGPQLQDRRSALVETKNKITEAHAERDLHIAEFYVTKRYYSSARMYFQLVMQDYPQTKSAARARERFEEIRDLQDPPDHFAWLKKIFPEE